MPSRLRQRDAIPVDEIQLGGGDWVKVRRWLTAQDRDEINAKMTKIDMDKGTGSVDVSFSNRATVLQALVEWGGPGFCQDNHEEGDDEVKGHTHKPVPITMDYLSLLPASDLQILVAYISRKNPRASGPSDSFQKGTTDGVS